MSYPGVFKRVVWNIIKPRLLRVLCTRTWCFPMKGGRGVACDNPTLYLTKLSREVVNPRISNTSVAEHMLCVYRKSLVQSQAYPVERIQYLVAAMPFPFQTWLGLQEQCCIFTVAEAACAISKTKFTEHRSSPTGTQAHPTNCRNVRIVGECYVLSRWCRRGTGAWLRASFRHQDSTYLMAFFFGQPFNLCCTSQWVHQDLFLFTLERGCKPQLAARAWVANMVLF